MYVPTVVNTDSSASQALAMNKQASARTKHIDLKYHCAKDALEKGLGVLHEVISVENPAEMLTKIVELKTLKHLTRIIGLSYN